MTRFSGLTIAVAMSMLTACKKDTPDDTAVAVAENSPYTLSHEGLPAPVIPGDNPLTTEGVKLGRFLFYETLLSANNNISCASCHVQAHGFSDVNTLSIGTDGLTGLRQAMASFNLAWNDNGFFWDGRADLLRHQALMPIQDPLEMNETLDDVVAKLQNSSLYPDQFRKAFGSSEITPEKISLALEQFMFSIVSNRSRYDQWLRGEVEFTEEEERGRYLFFTEYNPGFPDESGADCQHCHSGPNFSNNQYMNNGLDTDDTFTDLGREMVTGNANDRAKFKVTTLRNIELTPPYMHDGRFQTLEEVVEHYNLVQPSSTLQPEFEQQLPNGLQLSSSDKAALVAFLKTLTDIPLTQDERYSNPF
jgi:cytochrome c peroxidase